MTPRSRRSTAFACLFAAGATAGLIGSAGLDGSPRAGPERPAYRIASGKLGLHVMRKLRPPLEVSLRPLTEPQAGQPVELEARIESRVEITDLTVSWDLAPGARVVRGSPAETVPRLLPGQPVSARITVLLPADEANHQFTVNASYAAADGRLGAGDQLNTRPDLLGEAPLRLPAAALKKGEDGLHSFEPAEGIRVIQ